MESMDIKHWISWHLYTVWGWAEDADLGLNHEQLRLTYHLGTCPFGYG